MGTPTPKGKVKCPSCKKPVSWANNPHRPFCSERCAIIDLGNWADNQYSIEGKRVEENPEESSDEKPTSD